MRKARTSRELAGRLGLLLAGGLVALLLAELTVRLARPQAVWSYSPGLFVSAAPGELALRPGYVGRSGNRTEFETVVRINSAGLRGPELGPRPPGTARLLCLGDSFAFGVGVEDDEAYPALLGPLLRARGWPVESLNGALPAVGPVEEVAWLERHGLGLEPDLVLIGLFTGNDLLDAALGLEGWEVADGRLVASGTTRGLRAWLYFNSHLFAWAKSSVPLAAQRRLRAVLGMGEPPSLERARRTLELYARRPGALVRRGEERTAASLERLELLAGEHGFRAAAVLIPDLVALDPRLWSRALAELGADPEAYDPEAPRRRLGRLTAAAGLPTLDLAPAFRRARRDGERLYYRRDRHWNPAGHRLAARRIARFLLAAGLLERSIPGAPPARVLPAVAPGTPGARRSQAAARAG